MKNGQKRYTSTTQIILLLVFNFFTLFLVGNNYNFWTDTITFMKLYRDGTSITTGQVINEIQTQCWIGRTHIRCFYPVVEFITSANEKVIFTESNKYTLNSSLYGKSSKVGVIYSNKNPQIAKAFQGSDLTKNRLVGALWLIFLGGTLAYIDISYFQLRKLKQIRHSTTNRR